MKCRITSILALLTAFYLAPAFATEYTASFYGLNPPGIGPMAILEGTVDFSTNVSPLYHAISESDLTAFSLVSSYSPEHGPGSASWEYTLGDLLSFMFETAGPGIPPLFQLETDSINSFQGYIYPGQITISGVGTNKVSLMIDGSFDGIAADSLQYLPTNRVVHSGTSKTKCTSPRRD